MVFNGLKKYKMCDSLAGHIDGILHKCTSYARFLCVTGET